MSRLCLYPSALAWTWLPAAKKCRGYLLSPCLHALACKQRVRLRPSRAVCCPAGVNNDFLVKTLDPLTLLYNDRSPMENHHASAAFQLLLGDEQCAAFASTSNKVRA